MPQGKLEQARTLLRNVPRRGQVGALAQKYYGDVYCAEKKYEEAIQCYRAALLNSTSGEQYLADIDLRRQSEPRPGAHELVTLYRAAIAKRINEVRDELAERDWQAMFDQLQPQVLERTVGDRLMAAAELE